jgi:hypothetical protein
MFLFPFSLLDLRGQGKVEKLEFASARRWILLKDPPSQGRFNLIGMVIKIAC